LNTHIYILRDAVDRLMVEVNAIDRIIPEMLSSYPNWDLQDTTDFRDLVVTKLNDIITRLETI
jgi:hypothetical protein